MPCSSSMYECPALVNGDWLAARHRARLKLVHFCYIVRRCGQCAAIIIIVVIICVSAGLTFMTRGRAKVRLATRLLGDARG